MWLAEIWSSHSVAIKEAMSLSGISGSAAFELIVK
jgi:hypothetical protein